MHQTDSYLYGSDGGCVGLQNSDGCTGTQAPHPDGFVAARRGNESVLVVDRHVTDLCRVAAQRCEEPAVICGPDLHQAVIRTLKTDVGNK